MIFIIYVQISSFSGFQLNELTLTAVYLLPVHINVGRFEYGAGLIQVAIFHGSKQSCKRGGKWEICQYQFGRFPLVSSGLGEYGQVRWRLCVWEFDLYKLFVGYVVKHMFASPKKGSSLY